MRKPLPKGTLVHIPEAKRGHVAGSERILAKYGRLWVIDTPVRRTVRIHEDKTQSVIWYWCKSVTTGAFYDFHIDEMVIPED